MELARLIELLRFEGLETGDYEQVMPARFGDTSLFQGHDDFGPRHILLGQKRVAGIRQEPARPDQVLRLERILSAEYETEVRITKITDIHARKEVKEVYFLMHDSLVKVWVIKAEPEKTAREMTVYHIAHELGIPTGKPIGFTPTGENYPFDVAILGGILEHAGEPYDKLIENMPLAPKAIFSTALAIAGIIADYQTRMTNAMGEFVKYGIRLERASPRKEITERLLAGARIEADRGETLIRACEDLYDMQKGALVVSHGDIHGRNIVTVNTYFQGIGTSISRFGIIDWGSVMLDFPYGDLQDFWIHQKRKAESLCKYDYQFEQLEADYRKTMASRGIELDPRSALIQSLLWNIYELYDPNRSGDEVAEKARYHHKAAGSDLEGIERLGLKQARTIRNELEALMAEAYKTRAK